MTSPRERLVNNGLAIFLFHGVIAGNDYQVRNYTRKHLQREYFDEVIQELKECGYPLSMDEVVEYVQNGKPFPQKSFAVTFDDGFENNFSVAAPVLKDIQIPATFYVTTNFVEKNAMSWIDRIEYCLENCPCGNVLLPWNEAPYTFRSRETKIRLLEDIRFFVKREPSINCNSLVEDVFMQCGLEPVNQSDDPIDKKMSWEQVQRLSNDPDFIIGGHTHTHATMSFLNSEELEHEISTSLRLLEEKSSVKAHHYSYPEGLEHCYSDEVIEALKRQGIVCSPTAIDGINDRSPDFFRLKRITVI